MKRLLLDTNIYISAILFGGKPREIIDLARTGKVEIVISEYILWEIRKILKDKFDVPSARLNTIEHDVLGLTRLITVRSLVEEIKSDPADNHVLAGALDGKVDALVTGDKHLLGLKKYKGIRILPPDAFLKTRKDYP